MKKALCFLLAVVLTLSVATIGAVNVSAASSLKTSETAIAMLKKFEGFSLHPYYDYSQYTVGYGTRCPEEDYERYMNEGITEAEADGLLRQYLAQMQSAVNRFANKFNLQLSQNQFDALMMFTYNVGTNWVNKESTFRTAVINGDTGNDFLFAITRWSKAGKSVNKGLVNRRLIEADMYLNGSYSGVVPSNYSYVLFDFNDPNPNDKVNVVCETRVQGYDNSAPVAIRDAASLSGHRFLGWYTSKEDGTWVTDLDSSMNGITLYARWQDGNGPEGGNVTNYQRQVTSNAELSVYAEADSSSAVINTLKNGEQINIVADYVDAANVKWGKLSTGGWINLGFTASLSAASGRPEQNVVTVKVTGDRVNIRSGAGRNYAVVTNVRKGAVLPIFESVVVDGTPWGRCDKGWICLSYTDYNEAVQKPEDNKVVATGKVISKTNLRIRNGPGTGYSVVGSLASGTAVDITQIQTVGKTQWGRISEGWISLDYVKLDTPVEKPEATEPEAPKPTEPQTTEPEAPKPTEPQATEPEAPKPTEPQTTEPEASKPTDQQTTEPEAPNPTEPVKPQTVAGTVTATNLRIRSGAGTGNRQVGSLRKGSRVEILEQTTVDGNPWGRTEKGWICLTYVKLNESADSDNDTVHGVVTATKLNVRSGAGVSFSRVGSLPKGTKIGILEKKTVGRTPWGRTEKGWVSLDYVKLDGSAESGSQKPNGSSHSSVIASGSVTASSLHVRATAGTSGKEVKSLRKGTRVHIQEVTVVGGEPWGRISDGWICLRYVRLNSGSIPTAKMVSASNLNIRSGAGTGNSKFGAYTKGTAVVVLDKQTIGGNTWGRTDRGWISLKYTK